MEIKTTDETLERISAHPGVLGVVITSKDGIPIRTTLDSTATAVYTTNFSAIEERVSTAVREIDPTNSLVCMRILTKKYEVLIKPDPDYLIIALQTIKESNAKKVPNQSIF